MCPYPVAASGLRGFRGNLISSSQASDPKLIAMEQTLVNPTYSMSPTA